MSLSTSNARYLLASATPPFISTTVVESVLKVKSCIFSLRRSVAAEQGRVTGEGPRPAGPQTTTKNPDCHLDPI